MDPLSFDHVHFFLPDLVRAQAVFPPKAGVTSKLVEQKR